MSTSEQQGLVTPPGPRRKVAAVMFADMVGYSQRLEVDEATNSEQVTRSIDLFRSLISHYGGAMASVAGDGILALFESSERALSFAIQMRSEFREQAVWGDGEPIEFRIGLNLGGVTVSDANHRPRQCHRAIAGAAPGRSVRSYACRSATTRRVVSVMAGRPSGMSSGRVFAVEQSFRVPTGASRSCAMRHRARRNLLGSHRSRYWRCGTCRTIPPTTTFAKASSRM
jgi:hypothetical protein